MKLRKKLTSLLAMGGVACLALVGCSSGSDAAKTDAAAAPEVHEDLVAMLPDKYADATSLKVGITSTYPPMEYIDEATNELAGFDVDIITEILGRLGLEPEFDIMPKYDQIINAVDTERVDLSLTAMSDTPERREKLDFIDYISSGTMIYTTADSDLAEFEDLCGKSVALAQSTNYPEHIEQLAEEVCGSKDSIEIIGLDTTATAKLQLDQQRADAAVASPESYADMANRQPDTLKPVGEVIQPTLYGIGFSKDNVELREAILASLQSMFDDGTYEQIVNDWGLEAGLLEEPTVNKGEG
ncbi:ABC transporter substrate-binding protein [Gulosibacter sp. ACHW.36C]|uniref:ABC transporter substrate-binding protein n=1 Tax=Gulosibacter sediminis TaxID=1729695 RepID=A0ABY4MY07_9MICO|nr:ABC transporter substrate-binding protein [Gulosibacter sediminis]UQN14654.1 ABC transporter substrate-binding protein [Gulosibacter sediminis]